MQAQCDDCGNVDPVQGGSYGYCSYCGEPVCDDCWWEHECGCLGVDEMEGDDD